MYTTREAAKALDYADDAVIRVMIRDGRMRATKHGRNWIISNAEVEKQKQRRKDDYEKWMSTK